MASTNPMRSHMEERCRVCQTTRPHEVHLELVTESAAQETASYSREPYRITTCLDCGTTSKTRMNDA